MTSGPLQPIASLSSELHISPRTRGPPNAAEDPLPEASQAHISRSPVSRNPPSPPPLADPQTPKIVYRKTQWRALMKKKKLWCTIVALVIITILGILVTVYQKQVIRKLRPFSTYIRPKWWGWIVPVVVLVVLSIPPLFGHEIVGILCGAVYGLWQGFAIVAAGTFVGEILVYFAFKKYLRDKALAAEQKYFTYAALARVVREGGFLIVFMVRLSIIPGHISTAVFATCGVGFWGYAFASFITLPKQLILVYLGVLLGRPSEGATISDIVIGVTFLITLGAMFYVFLRLRRMKKIMEADPSIEIQGVIEGDKEEYHMSGARSSPGVIRTVQSNAPLQNYREAEGNSSSAV